MTEQLITYETAKLTKQKSFNEYTSYMFEESGVEIGSKCSGDYKHSDWDKHIIRYSRPTQSLLQRWLREIHNIHVIMKPVIGSKNGYDSYPMLGWDFDIIGLNKNSTNSYYMGYPIGDWFTATLDRFDEGDTLEDLNVNPLEYEEALELGLQAGLKLIKI